MNPLELAGLTASQVNTAPVGDMQELCRALLRAQLRVWHPDRGGDEDTVRALNEALEIVGDLPAYEVSRAAYLKGRRSFESSLVAGRARVADYAVRQERVDQRLAALLSHPFSENEVTAPLLRDSVVRLAALGTYRGLVEADRKTLGPRIQGQPILVMPRPQRRADDPRTIVFESDELEAFLMDYAVAHDPGLGPIVAKDRRVDKQYMSPLEHALICETKARLIDCILLGATPADMDLTALPERLQLAIEKARPDYAKYGAEEVVEEPPLPPEEEQGNAGEADEEEPKEAAFDRSVVELEIDGAGNLLVGTTGAGLRLVGTVAIVSTDFDDWNVRRFTLDATGAITALGLRGDRPLQAETESALKALLRSFSKEVTDLVNVTGVPRGMPRSGDYRMAVGALLEPEGGLSLEFMGVILDIVPKPLALRAANYRGARPASWPAPEEPKKL